MACVVTRASRKPRTLARSRGSGRPIGPRAGCNAHIFHPPLPSPSLPTATATTHAPMGRTSAALCAAVLLMLATAACAVNWNNQVLKYAKNISFLAADPNPANRSGNRDAAFRERQLTAMVQAYLQWGAGVQDIEQALHNVYTGFTPALLRQALISVSGHRALPSPDSRGAAACDAYGVLLIHDSFRAGGRHGSRRTR